MNNFVSKISKFRRFLKLSWRTKSDQVDKIDQKDFVEVKKELFEVDRLSLTPH